MIKHLLLLTCMGMVSVTASARSTMDSGKAANAPDKGSELTVVEPAHLETRIEPGDFQSDYRISIQSDQATEMLMQVLDARGRNLGKVERITVQEGETIVRLNLDAYPPGAYLVSLQAPHQRSAVIHSIYR